VIKSYVVPRVAGGFEVVGRALARLPLSPTQWTLLGLACGLASGVLIATRHFFLAGVALFVVIIADTADGLVARIRNQHTAFGGLLDVIVDKYVEGAVFVGAAFVSDDFGVPAPVWAAIGLWGSIIVSLVSNVGQAKMGRPAFKLADRAVRGIIGVIALLLTSLFGSVMITAGMIAIGVLSHVTVLGMLLHYAAMQPRQAPAPVAAPL
jgi:phosphatidylglycerophosphate synthase